MKEKNSESVKYTFYCTVKVGGEIVDENSVVVETAYVSYSIEKFDASTGKGTLKFSHPVNMDFL